MNIRFLCNAGISIEHNGMVLLIDLPNGEAEPFYMLSDEVWDEICRHKAPFSNVSGFFFTHDHPDHLNKIRLSRYLDETQNIEVFMPDSATTRGSVDFGVFHIEYQRFEHAPLPAVPPHVVAKIAVGSKSVYVSGDAAMNCEEHKRFLGEKKVDAAIWTPMYLSRPETRELIMQVSEKNFIYHMPLRNDAPEIWKKCDKNLQRYHSEVNNVVVVDRYPYTVEI